MLKHFYYKLRNAQNKIFSTLFVMGYNENKNSVNFIAVSSLIHKQTPFLSYNL